MIIPALVQRILSDWQFDFLTFVVPGFWNFITNVRDGIRLSEGDTDGDSHIFG